MDRVAKWASLTAGISLVSWIAYFPSPYGFETRPVLGLSPIFGAPFAISFLLNLVLIPMLWRRPKLGSILAILLGVLFIIGVVFDQAGLATPGLTPPPLVTTFEVEGSILSVLLVVLGAKIYN
ncbi:MAG: hypothetical protein OK452_10785 [Thaumarchaeota archaeon]|nr:hypothetical protein [Nitrososphaerota archaeon]